MPTLPRKLLLACIIAAFFVASFAVFGSALESEFVTWDDMFLIHDNQNVQEMTPRSIKNVFTSYDPELYIPLTLMSYQIDHAIAGMQPSMFHLTNLVLHILNSLLVTWFLYLVLRRGWLALGLGAIFLLHPLNTEAVLWASARKDVLSTFFFLASLLGWMHFRESKKKPMYMLSIFLFLCGSLSKVMVVTLPIVFIMLDWLEGRSFSRKAIMEKVPFFVIAAVFAVVGLFGKTQVFVASTVMQKILMACKATIFYLVKFFLPANLSVMYPYTKSISLSSPDFFIPVFFVLVMLGFLWFLRRKKLALFGILFYLLTLTPTFTNFIKGGDVYVASDRYAYIPMIGLLIFVGFFVARWLDRPGSDRAYHARYKTFYGCTGILCVLFAYLSTAQAAIWKDSTTLYTSVLKQFPNARAAHNNLGMEFLATGQYADAIAEFDSAIAIRPDPRTKANRAAALVAMGSLDEALTEFQKALVIDPNLPDALYGIGNIYQRRGELQKAAEQYRRTLAADPNYANALNNLGAVYILLADWDHAIEALKTAIQKRPDFVESYYNLAGAYEQKGMKSEAEEMYRKALAFHPGDPDALARLATLVYARGDIDQAAKLLQESLQIDSSNPTAISLVLRMKKDGVAE